MQDTRSGVGWSLTSLQSCCLFGWANFIYIYIYIYTLSWAEVMDQETYRKRHTAHQNLSLHVFFLSNSSNSTNSYIFVFDNKQGIPSIVVDDDWNIVSGAVCDNENKIRLTRDCWAKINWSYEDETSLHSWLTSNQKRWKIKIKILCLVFAQWLENWVKSWKGH